MSAVSLPADSIDFVCTLVRQQSAIELDAAKAYLIEARLSPVAKRLGYMDTSELVRQMKVLPKRDVQQQVVEALTTNETSFYRDIHPFEALRGTIIPEIIRRRSAQKSLNIWSAACSTGQEAYSIAMLLREHFAELNNWKVNIIGTDLSEEVLAKARAGRFSQIEMNRGLPANLLTKYFVRDGLNWVISQQIRNLATFSKLNLIERWAPLPPFDVVFLRNVLIYFSPATKRMILEKIRAVMAPQAVLFLGAAETTMNLDSEFVRVQVGNQVYYTCK